MKHWCEPKYGELNAVHYTDVIFCFQRYCRDQFECNLFLKKSL